MKIVDQFNVHGKTFDIVEDIREVMDNGLGGGKPWARPSKRKNKEYSIWYKGEYLSNAIRSSNRLLKDVSLRQNEEIILNYFSHLLK